jgi:purine catabolism regulator
MLTLQQLLDEVGIQPVSGSDATGTPIRWVHISELPDPTPWLSGGELLLTTGIQLDSEAAQVEFVERLAAHRLAGLGFGTGLRHDGIPAALVAAAAKLDFPVFEVPYEMPFIALTERAFGHLVNEQYELLQRGIAVHRRLEQLVVEERGLEEVARALATTIGGTVLVYDAQGRAMAHGEFRRELSDHAREAISAAVRSRRGAHNPDPFNPSHEQIEGRTLALPVAATGRPDPDAWLVAVRDTGALGEFERLILQQTVTIVALELMRRRVVRDTERRLAGDVLAEAVAGEIEPAELRSRLGAFGIGDRATVLLFALDGPDRAEALLGHALADAGLNALVATQDSMLCAVVGGDESDPIDLGRQMRGVLSRSGATVRAGVSRVAPLEAVRRSYHEARCALSASAFANGDAPEVASYTDLGAYQLLLSVQDDDALNLYCENVLGPIENGEGEYGGELIKSLEAFLDHNGQWEKASRQLYCHRHTLRYRIRRIEELTGRDLSSARDRIEFWLALQARELVR